MPPSQQNLAESYRDIQKVETLFKSRHVVGLLFVDANLIIASFSVLPVFMLRSRTYLWAISTTDKDVLFLCAVDFA